MSYLEQINKGFLGQSLTRAERERYSRHLVLPEVGEEGQRKLKSARVLVIGAGGLGSPVLLYLTAAGVGQIGVLDFDRVDLSNIQRQIVHSSHSVGRAKVESARESLEAVNPGVKIHPLESRLDPSNALKIFTPYDLVIDGSDNFQTRYLVNDACVLLGKPCVYGSVQRFEGQVSVFWPGKGPCYRCLFPQPPPAGEIPSCAEAGVLGVVPGIIGSLQALEALKIILGRGNSLIGRLLVFDGLTLRFREVKLKRDPACPVCGNAPTIRTLMDTTASCQSNNPNKPKVPEIRVADLKTSMENNMPMQIIDVREPKEHAGGAIPGALLIPLAELPKRLGELDKTKTIVLHCQKGGRSAKACEIVMAAGFANAVSVAGGYDAWKQTFGQ